ncbi:hypothetical protein OIO90_002117 [Microbotryomycetes sp. JL221]|nr:hypothetical protein OIO90_002117 [Microbotryomycetes sp. JL221]
MAGGLFTVYRDMPDSAADVRSTSKTTSSRRQQVLLQDKENMLGANKTAVKSKPDKLNKSDKVTKVVQQKPATTSFNIALKGSPPRPTATNGVCTGTLRNRIVPGFDELGQDPNELGSQRQLSRPMDTHRPRDISTQQQPGVRAANMSSASVKPFKNHTAPSSYAAKSKRSCRATRVAHSIYHDPQEAASESAKTRRTTDQIARDLTESPLAEAYTSQGRFCVANMTEIPMSPTPASTLDLPNERDLAPMHVDSDSAQPTTTQQANDHSTKSRPNALRPLRF